MDCVDGSGHSPLYYACLKKLVSVVNTLVKAGLKLSPSETQELKKKFFSACEDGEMKMLKCLMAAGFDCTTKNVEGQTGFIVAAKAGQEDALMILAKTADDVNVLDAVDSEGNSALHWAVMSGELPLVEALVSTGANLSPINEEGSTPLHVAEVEGFEDIFHLLKSRGAMYGDQVHHLPRARSSI